jgi:hypothetical protein
MLKEIGIIFTFITPSHDVYPFPHSAAFTEWARSTISLEMRAILTIQFLMGIVPFVE